MSKLLTCLMFIPLAVVTYWEITTHSSSFPVGIGFIVIGVFSIVVFFLHGIGKKFICDMFRLL